VKERASSKEEEAALLVSILKRLHELKSQPSTLPLALRYDSKMDIADIAIAPPKAR
jgi:hypothetical protein